MAYLNVVSARHCHILGLPRYRLSGTEEGQLHAQTCSANNLQPLLRISNANSKGIQTQDSGEIHLLIVGNIYRSSKPEILFDLTLLEAIAIPGLRRQTRIGLHMQTTRPWLPLYMDKKMHSFAE